MRTRSFGLLAALLLTAPLAAHADGYEALSSAGRPVLKACNPEQLASEDECRVDSAPGLPGYSLVAARSSDIVKNEVVIGTLFDRVWKDAAGNYIFGARVVMNAEPWDLSGAAFNVNDLMRQVLPGRPVSVAYAPVGTPPSKPLRYAGRTVQGLNEYETAQPARDNGWVDFGIDANAAEIEGPSRARSPWLLVKTRAPAGFSLQPFAIRLLSSDVADFSEIVEIFTAGYQPDEAPSTPTHPRQGDTMKKIATLSSSVLAALGLAHLPAQADWIALPTTGTPTLKVCNPKINIDTPTETQSATVTTCKVTGLPGSTAIPGYILKSTRTAPIVINSKTVGTLHDRVWCKGTGTTCDATNTYILGLRAQLNTTAWNPSGASFEINDYFRSVRSAVSVDASYFMGTVDGGTAADTALAKKYLEYTGRTLQGLFEPSTSAQTSLTKTRNNAWANFRVDTNANDPDSNPPFSVSSPWSPWMFVRQVCPTGYNATAQTLKVRLWEGGEEGQAPQAILTSGYVCN